jgi:hypothetical protein
MAKDKAESVERSDIGELVRRLETNYISGTTTVSKYVQKSMKDDIDMIGAYINSKHTTGLQDSQGRDKPFFNVVTAARNIWYRATDLDRKDVKVKAKKMKHTMLAFLATIKLRDWMDRAGFGKFLNKWGLTLATYGSAVLKFVVKDGELHSDVVAWDRLIVDPISFDNNVVIEVLELTEAQLRNREGYDQEMVENLCEAITTRKTIAGETKDMKPDYIKVYEVHGELPLSYLTGKASDEYTYVQQMHVISFVAGKENGTYDDYTLVSGREENPYMITHLIEEDGQTLSIGAVQNLFEVQWMMNHTAKSIKDQLDLASKLIFQTSDGNFVGQNALAAIENGDILVHAVNQPLTQVANTSHDITALQNFQTSWKMLGQEINGIAESMLGAAPKSHTAWKQTQAVINESYSLFEMMTENKRLDLAEMLTRFIIPFIKKYELNNADEIAAELESYDLNRIDSAYIANVSTKMVNQQIIEKVLNDEEITPEDQAFLTEQAASSVQKNLASLGNQRFFAPDEINWSKELKDLEWELEIEVPGESEDTEAALTTLDTTLKTLVALQGRPMTPDERLVFNKILTKTGQVSPAELVGAPPAQPSPMQPAMPQPTM